MGIQNQIKTVILIGALTGILLGVGYLIGGASGLTIAFIISLLMNFVSYFFSDKIVLFMYQAKQITEKENPRLFKLVREISQMAHTPMPKVYIINSQHSNAFATGRNPKHAAVACTDGILNLLNDAELKGVIAHEISHITNRDILIQSVAATIAGTIAYVASMARWAALFGGFGGRDDRDVPGILEFLVLAILTPILATLIQLAISRSREYLADETAAKLVHSGSGLASALEKLDGDIARKPLPPNGPTESTAHMMIANPFGKMKGLLNLFSTHPPIDKRIKKLRELRI